MKLYATTTSERATSGQGGNRFLKIELQVGKKRVFIGKINIQPSPTVKGNYILQLLETTPNGKETGNVLYGSVAGNCD
jgi:hypothetical protein